ncbi:Kelch repeat-containing protein [Marinifilum flexuosum]|uniref:Kelch repeat-containing protein n=1 Tax=Marinifilum flexuosum TaxID=1117708 RepID=UPI00248FCC4F|nr:hypothetical protein [Marinifilum flexuosum]
MTERILLILILAFSLFSCSDSESLKGNWIKSSSFEGERRSGAVSFVIGDYAYVGTGCTGTKEGDSNDSPWFVEYKCLKSFYKYSLEDGWTKIMSEFPGEARTEAVAFIANGKAYVGSGVNINDERLADFYEFDPTTGIWNPNPIDMTNGPSARQGAVAFSINDIGYVGTGYGFIEDDDRCNLKDFYKFENGIWSKVNFDNEDGERTRNSTAFVINNKAYIVSGENNMRQVWEYDPASITNTYNGWSRKKNLHKDNRWENVMRTQAVSFVINDKGYITTGHIGKLLRDVWEYDPILDHWEEKTPLELEINSRTDAVAFSLDNRGFITTGTLPGSGYYFDDTWEFNPVMDQDDNDN